MSRTISITKSVIVSMRPRQWIKSLFVLLPVYFSGNATQLDALTNAVLAAVLFALVSSSLYLWNDIRDQEEDRRHPVKRFRPIASGALPVSVARSVAVVLSVGGVAAAFALNTQFGWILLVYAALMIAYSAGLKRIIIFDTLIIVVGFLLQRSLEPASTSPQLSLHLRSFHDR